MENQSQLDRIENKIDNIVSSSGIELWTKEELEKGEKEDENNSSNIIFPVLFVIAVSSLLLVLGASLHKEIESILNSVIKWI